MEIVMAILFVNLITSGIYKMQAAGHTCEKLFLVDYFRWENLS